MVGISQFVRWRRRPKAKDVPVASSGVGLEVGARLPPKASAQDYTGRFREIISDPINLLIRRVPGAGVIHGDLVCLHNGNLAAISGPHAYYGDFSAVLCLNRGVHEPLEEYVFQRVLDTISSPPLMLELGAYWAHYSMWVKRKFPRAETVMIEPDRVNLEAGRFNFSTNGMSGEFINEFVGKGAFSVDSFIANRGIQHLTLLHADIQGFELEMLERSGNALSARKIDYLFVSTHSQELHERVRASLADHGYRVEISSDFDMETTSFDGFIFASSPRLAPVFNGFRPLGRIDIVKAGPQELLLSLESLVR